jgi:hypothetical protein
MIREKLSLGSSNSTQSDDGTESAEDEIEDHKTRSFQVTVEHEASDDEPGTIPETHQTLVAPSNITEEPAAVRTGDRWTRTLWAGEYPDAPMDGFLEKLYAAAETRNTDIAIHIDPRDAQATLDTLENRIEDLQADYEYLTEKHRASARGVEKDLSDHEEMYDVLRNTPMEAFDVSAYLAVRGDDRDDVDASDVMATARRAPANLTPVAPRWSQLDALISCSPTATDRLAETLDAKTPMLGGAVGAMFPFVSGAFAEPGIEYGTYALNVSPLILDRFERETGYCAMVIGRLGAGKSFATKLRPATTEDSRQKSVARPTVTGTGSRDRSGANSVASGASTTAAAGARRPNEISRTASPRRAASRALSDFRTASAIRPVRSTGVHPARISFGDGQSKRSLLQVSTRRVAVTAFHERYRRLVTSRKSPTSASIMPTEFSTPNSDSRLCRCRRWSTFPDSPRISSSRRRRDTGQRSSLPEPTNRGSRTGVILLDSRLPACTRLPKSVASELLRPTSQRLRT